MLRARPAVSKTRTPSSAPTTRGTVYAWGSNNAGQVGDGNGGTARQPVAVDFGAVAISATADDVAVSVFFHH